MLTSLNVSCLARKCVFYRPELTGKWAPHKTEIKLLELKTNRAQIVDEKNGVIRLVIIIIIIADLFIADNLR